MAMLLFLLLGALVQSVNALTCLPCDKIKCVAPVDCKDGVITGVCGCCDVCAKTNGERCGGAWNIQGRCAKGLKCVTSSASEKENDFLPKHFHIGICKRDVCENKKCGFKEICKTNRHNRPVCICPRKCGKFRRQPVCGLTNGKQYRNRCGLTREECKLKKEIGLTKGLCKKCIFEDKKYRSGTTRQGGAPCEACLCLHGSWKCQVNVNCSVNNMPSTTGNKQSCMVSYHNNIVLPCPRGFSCRVSPSADNKGTIRFGICKKKIVKKPKTNPILVEIHGNKIDSLVRKENEERIPVKDSTPTTVKTDVLVPTQPQKTTIVLMPTEPHPEQPLRRLPSIGMGLIHVCMAKPDKRSCVSPSVTRWFYNATSKTCEQFLYGGCSGNFNNFVTQGKCQEICHSGFVDNSVPPTTFGNFHRTTGFSNNLKKLSEMCHDIKTGKSYNTGEQWNIDDCTSCSCDSGQSHCVAETCFAACSMPVYVKGVCCPVCDPKTKTLGHAVDSKETRCQDVTTGFWYQSGDSWMNDECVKCICFDGQTSCMRSACSIPYCDNPVKKDGECCAVCPKKTENERQGTTEIETRCEDSRSGKSYKPGEGWKVGDCMSCFCGNDEKSVCHELTCRTPKCKHPVHLQGRCCPICPDSFLSACTYNDQQYFKDEFTLLGDMCTLCKCNGKHWTCSEMHCSKNGNVISTLVPEHNKVVIRTQLTPTLPADHTDEPSESDIYDHFIVEDPIRMSRNRQNMPWSVAKLPVARNRNNKDSEQALMSKTIPTTKVVESRGHTPTGNAVRTGQGLFVTTSDDINTAKPTATKVSPLFKEQIDSSNVDGGTTNNRTIVYRKRL